MPFLDVLLLALLALALALFAFAGLVALFGDAFLRNRRLRALVDRGVEPLPPRRPRGEGWFDALPFDGRLAFRLDRLLDEDRRRHRLRREAEALAADPEDRAEKRRILEQMDELAAA